ncbi:MAG TPA: metal-dependent hydrolase [Dongiaceae bacterium]|nr:metal-dependent hydrolase [Dongiaceae bacterium]
MAMLDAADTNQTKRVPQPRRPKFAFTEEMRRRWCKNTIFYTMLLNAYTIMFPAIERFTVTCLRQELDGITDPVLKARVQAMIAQEAMHGKRHDESLAALKQHHVDYDYMYRFSEFVMSLWIPLHKNLGRLFRGQLLVGIIAAGEHWTTLISRWNLRSNAFRYEQSPLAKLFLWHAVEEVEHKSVAFDLLEYKGGGYFIRIFTFILTTFIFFFLNFTILIFLTGQLRLQEVLHPRFYVEILMYCFFWQATVPLTLWGMIEYCLPYFHPDKHNDEPALAEGLRLLQESNLAIE